MGLVFVSIALLLVVILVVILFCSLIIAKRSDDEMKNILGAYQCKIWKDR